MQAVTEENAMSRSHASRSALGLGIFILIAALPPRSALAMPQLFGTDASGSGPGSSGKLLTIDQTTGVASLVGFVGFEELSGITCSRAGVLYGSLGALGGGQIITIDRTTGAGTLVGSSGFASVQALTTSRSGTLYGSAGATSCADTLVTIDALSGVATAVGGTYGGGSIDIDGMNAIAFDPADVLYGVTGSCDTFAPGPALYVIDRSTGGATLVGRVVDAMGAPPVADPVGLEFLPDGTLLASTAGEGDIIAIDPATGVFTLVGSSGRGNPVTALAYCGCDPAPVAAGCDVASGRSQLGIVNKADDTKDKLAWKWQKGSVTPAALGDPVAGTTTYVLCVYDDSALVMSARIPRGGTCPGGASGKPCWKAVGNPLGSKGFTYADKAGTPDGVATLAFRPGVGGRAQISLAGKGANLLMPPTMPLAQSTAVTVQLFKSDGAECWQAAYLPSAVRNTSEVFKDKTP